MSGRTKLSVSEERLEGITRGPLPSSRKIFRTGALHPEVRVPVREILGQRLLEIQQAVEDQPRRPGRVAPHRVGGVRKPLEPLPLGLPLRPGDDDQPEIVG